MNEQERDQLIDALLDGEISEADFLRLEAEFSVDPQAREAYYERLKLSCLLATDAELVSEEKLVHSVSHRSQWRNWSVRGLAAAACVLFGIGLSMMVSLGTHRDPSENQVAVDRVIARVAQIDGDAWFEEVALAEGMDVSRGRIRVDSGRVELAYGNGTVLLLDGPAEMDLYSGMKAFLRLGQVAARVSEEAYGFTLLGPGSAVTDLGTEFSMAVKDDLGWVEVFDGEVDVALLDENGHPWKSRRLATSGPVRFESSKGEIIDDSPLRALPRFSRPSIQTLNVPVAYSDAVLKDSPVHYWNFDAVNGNQMEDVFGGSSAILNGDAQHHEGAIHFPRKKRNKGFIFIDEPFPTLLNGEFTLEIWVNPYATQKATLIDVKHRNPASQFQEQLHRLTLLPAQQQSPYPSDSFRFNCNLWPYEDEGTVNVFSAGRYTPGKWHHVVMVRRHDRLEIYLDGVSERSAPAPPPSSTPLPTSITLGRYSARTHPSSKGNRFYFHGYLDEFAIYPTALSPEQIARHYKLMNEAAISQ